MFLEAYVFLMVAVIPFISWQQREEGRNVISILITGTFAILWLLTGTAPIVWDQATIFVACFAGWMIASLSWSYSRQSNMDLYSMAVGLVVFMAAREISLDVLAPMLFVPGFVFAAASLYYRNSLNKKRQYFIFGNSNHLAAFLIVPLFCGIWMAFILSPFMALPTAVIGLMIALTRCRGAQIGVIAGLVCTVCMQSVWGLALIPVAILTVYLILRVKGANLEATLYESASARASFRIAAVILIKKAPFAGHGLRTFRREYPNVVPNVIENRKRQKMLPPNTTVESQCTHRVHNDHLELIVELGFIGYFLFLAIFWSIPWAENPLISGALVAFAVHGLFFFPLREAHTANPFFAMAGGLAASSGSVIAINPLLAAIIVLIIGRILYSMFVKALGLAYYDNSAKIAVLPNAETEMEKNALRQKQAFLNNAIKCDPYNNVYLTEGYYYNVFNNPEIAFQYASRCMENYDGGKVKWGVCDQYARALLRLGGFGVAKMAISYALQLCPDFKQSIELNNQLMQMDKQTPKGA